jgi:hypothetical protein
LQVQIFPCLSENFIDYSAHNAPDAWNFKTFLESKNPLDIEEKRMLKYELLEGQPKN